MDDGCGTPACFSFQPCYSTQIFRRRPLIRLYAHRLLNLLNKRGHKHLKRRNVTLQHPVYLEEKQTCWIPSMKPAPQVLLPRRPPGWRESPSGCKRSAPSRRHEPPRAAGVRETSDIVVYSWNMQAERLKTVGGASWSKSFI